MGPMATGTVKWFDDAKGFGFLSQDTGQEAVFCHRDAIAELESGTLTPGQKVAFELTRSANGLCAANVRSMTR